MPRATLAAAGATNTITQNAGDVLAPFLFFAVAGGGGERGDGGGGGDGGVGGDGCVGAVAGSAGGSVAWVVGGRALFHLAPIVPGEASSRLSKHSKL